MVRLEGSSLSHFTADTTCSSRAVLCGSDGSANILVGGRLRLARGRWRKVYMLITGPSPVFAVYSQFPAVPHPAAENRGLNRITVTGIRKRPWSKPLTNMFLCAQAVTYGTILMESVTNALTVLIGYTTCIHNV